MKILWVTGSFYPANIGGMDTIMYWIARSLKSRDVQLTLLTPNKFTNNKVRGNTWYQTDYGNINYIPTLIHYLPVRLIIAAYRQLFSHRNIHLCNVFYPSSIAVALLAALKGRKVLWSVHGELDPWARNYRWYKKKPFLWIIRHFLKNKVVFHATCPAEVQYIKQAVGQDAEVILIPNYILLPAKQKATPEKYFLFVGRIHPKKGLNKLIEALDLSSAFRSSGFKLKIVGDYNNSHGHELQSLCIKLGLEKQVQFMGKVNGPAKFKIFAGAYFSFMPSITENFGMVVVESLSQGTPAVATQGTPWEVLAEEDAGFWIPNDVKSLAQTIDQILAMPSTTYQAYRANAYQLVCEQFDMDKNIDKWLQAYQSIFYSNR